MADIILYAADVYSNDKQAWANLVKQAMAEDFSWHNIPNEYLDVSFTTQRLSGMFVVEIGKNADFLTPQTLFVEIKAR